MTDQEILDQITHIEFNCPPIDSWSSNRHYARMFFALGKEVLKSRKLLREVAEAGSSKEDYIQEVTAFCEDLP